MAERLTLFLRLWWVRVPSRPAPLIGLTTYDRPADFFGKQLPLVGLTRPYIRAVRAAGGVPVLLPHGAPAEEWAALMHYLDGLILPGGEDVDPAVYRDERIQECGIVDRERDRLELGLARRAIESALPLLGICRGHQVLNVAQGGSLWQDIAAQLPTAQDHSCSHLEDAGLLAHNVRIKGGSLLAGVIGKEEIGTNSSHHQAIRTVGAGLVVTAWAPDGVIEGVELPGHPFAVGVQWHPERMCDRHPPMLRLFEALVEAAHDRSRSRSMESLG